MADLLVAAWLMSTAAAGVFEAKKMQKMLLLPQLGAESCEELIEGAGVRQDGLLVSLRVCATANHGLASACVGMLRARGPWCMECVWTCVASSAVADLSCSTLFARAHA